METHSWEQECLSVVGSGSVSYFCRRVKKYVFDYKLQKRKSVSGKLTFTAGMQPRACRTGQVKKGGGCSGSHPAQTPSGMSKGISHTWSEPRALWVVSSTAVHNLSKLLSFMS